MIECNNLKKYFGDRLILKIDELKIYTSERIGIVGENGAGKTTLLKIISGAIKADEGRVRLEGRTAYITQLDYPPQKNIAPEWAAKFGVPILWQDTLSGGEKTRFKLAAALSSEPEILLADEPTGNLDLEALELLEKKFSEYKGALLLVSHDRKFLDSQCHKILEIRRGEIKVYQGNYSAYREQKKAEEIKEATEYAEYLDEKKRLQGAMRELGDQSRKVRKAPCRMGNSEARLHKMGDQRAKHSLDRAKKGIKSRLEQLAIKEKPENAAKIKLDIVSKEKRNDKVIIRGENISRSFGEKIIFNDAGFVLRSGAKVALFGVNGSGKTTLLRMIAEGAPGIESTKELKSGYFSQEMDILQPELSILDNVMRKSIYPEHFARTLLARLLFRREDVSKKVEVLSGGERVKLSFAKIILEDYDLLLLDEPTNYLDIPALEVIEEALQSYQGTMLFVSHDREFCEKIADEIMVIEAGKIIQYQGSYTEYLNKKRESERRVGSGQKAELLVLENRLAEVIGKIAAKDKKSDLSELDREFSELKNKIDILRLRE